MKLKRTVIKDDVYLHGKDLHVTKETYLGDIYLAYPEMFKKITSLILAYVDGYNIIEKSNVILGKEISYNDYRELKHLFGVNGCFEKKTYAHFSIISEPCFYFLENTIDENNKIFYRTFNSKDTNRIYTEWNYYPWVNTIGAPMLFDHNDTIEFCKVLNFNSIPKISQTYSIQYDKPWNEAILNQPIPLI